MDKPQRLYPVIRKLRLYHGVQAKAIASAIGKSPAQYSKIESGATRLSFYDFLQMLHFLKTPPAIVHQFLEETGITALSCGQSMSLDWLKQHPNESLPNADVMNLTVQLAKYCRENGVEIRILASGKVEFNC